MKTTLFLTLTLLTLIFLPSGLAQDDPHQLPEGVKNYIRSSGKITGNMQYSPDGKRTCRGKQ